MNMAKKSLINKVCAILMVMLLTISDFLFVGEAVVSYAIDMVETNHANVDFSAYFLNTKGEKVENLEENIDKEDQYLYVDIAVKNEGYFNGTIRLNDNNFNIKPEKLSDAISQISGNEVTLNQINAGSTVTIKLGIEAVKDDVITENTLQAKTKVSLEGQYINSKNVEKEKYIDIKGTTEVQVNWKSSEETKAELEAQLLTNSIYQINGEEKRVLQIVVSSKITANNYPVKDTQIDLSVPEKVEQVEVHERSTKATNHNLVFNHDSYTYEKENNKLAIKLSNEDRNHISWNKDVQDIFVVTYVFNKEENINNKEITVNSNIKTYDAKELKATQNVHIEKEIDGIISYSVEMKEESIYKGKIYTGEERDYDVINKVNVDYLDVVNDIKIKGNEAIYLANEEEREANIVYKETRIDKEEFLKIFGEDGYITVQDTTGKVIANINKNSETDENGKIIISYLEETKCIELITSKPIAIGTLNIENTKSILNNNDSREDVNKLTGIKEGITANYNEKEMTDKETTMELRNTSSKALLDVSTTTLSTTDKNENVKITAVLLNNDESRDLYQDPVIKITLPKQVTGVSAKCKLLYGNGLELSNAKIVKENEAYVIEVALTGTQNSYNTETLEGTTIIIYANLEVDKLATNSEEEIKLSYTNNIATNFEDNGEEKVPVKIAANSGMIITNDMVEYGIQTIGDQGTKNVALEVSKEEKEATINVNVINNEGTSISNVAVLGKFPTGKEANLGATLTSGINITSNTQNVNVYYSENENPTTDLKEETNGWSTEYDVNKIKSYLIIIDSMQIGEQFEANYTIKIPENLSYNLKAEESYVVNYTNNLTEVQKTAKATTLNLTTGTGAEITSSLKAYVGGNEIANGDTVYNGEVVRYELTFKNTGSEVAKNVNIEANIPNNTTMVQYVKGTDNHNDDSEDVLSSTSDYYQEIETPNNKLTKTMETLEVGEKKTFAYEVRINDEAVNNTISAKATMSYYGTENTTDITTNETNTITNMVSNAEVSMNMIMIARGSTTLHAGISYSYYLTVTNTSGKKLSDVKVAIKTNSEYSLERVLDENENNMNCEDSTFTIKSLEEGESVSYEIDVKASNQDGTATISAIANNLYRSNEITETIKATDMSISMTSNNEGGTIKNGDSINYQITVKNNGDEPIDFLEIGQQISTYLDVEKVTINGEEIEFEEEYLSDNKEEETSDEEETETVEDDSNTMEESDKYLIGFNYEKTLAKEESLTIVVEAATDSELIHTSDVHMVSVAEATTKDLTVKSEEINHILTANVSPEVTQPSEDPEEPEKPEKPNPSEDPEKPQPEGPETPGTNEEPSGAEENYTISGTAWLDTNENGQRDSEEQILNGIKVTLLNLENNETSTVTTSENGFYSFINVKNGKYVAIFEYDTEKYVLTTYQAEGISTSRNSDVENITMNIEGTSKKVASTDTLQINGNNVTNIDIGLIEAKAFDLELSKTITKISVTNAEGTKISEYNDASLAKVEVKAKYLKGTTVVIEYKIKVTNKGEVAGYVKNIVDYKPSDLSFNSSINPEWYQSGDYLYSTSISNEKIEAGQTKELTLILTKTMTESNTGLVNNTAEIKEDYNSLGIADVDSTAGNKNAKEDDMGNANVIINVSTGAAVSYIALTVSIIAMIAAGVYIISKKILKENIKL